MIDADKDESDLEIACRDLMEEANSLSNELRVRKVRSLSILDTDPEQIFNDIVAVAAQVCQTNGAVLTFIDSDRAYIKANHRGIVGEEPLDHAFCTIAIQNPSEMMVVRDATNDARVSNNPKVTSGAIRFYAGMPLVTPDGHAVGSLCVIDPKPRDISYEESEALKALARVAMNITLAKATKA